MHPSVSSSTQLGILVLRVSLGAMWIAHALLKLLVFTLPGTAQFFASIGFPGFLAYPVFAAELIGGAALLLGVYARQVALGLVPVMAVAAWVHLPNGWVHTSTGGGWEYPVFLIAASIALWLLGDGAAAIKRSALLVPRFRVARFGKSPFEPSTAKEISRSSTTLSNLGRVSLRPRVRDALRAEGLVK